MSDCPQVTLTVGPAPSVVLTTPTTPSLALCMTSQATTVLVTGSRPLSIANLTGIGGLSVFSSGQYVFFSGGAGGGGGSGDVTQSQLLSASGALVSQISAASAGVLSLNSLSGFVNLVGLGGVSLSTSGQTIFISGGSGNGSVTQVQLDALSGWAAATISATGSAVYNAVLALSGGTQAFSVSVPTGIDTLAITYPQVFASTPVVTPTLNVTGAYTYGMYARSFNPTGFSISFTDVIAESGVSINVIAKLPSP